VGQTALVILVPEAEGVVADLRDAHDPAAARAVPAHVTVLYPFRSLVDDETAGATATLARSILAFDARFASVGRFPGEVVFLAPEPRGSFKRMIDRAVATFPDCPPYGGTIAEPEPHLTVADGVDPTTAGEIEHAVAPGLPIMMRVDRLTLLIEGDDGRWSIDRSWPLGGDSPA